MVTGGTSAYWLQPEQLEGLGLERCGLGEKLKGPFGLRLEMGGVAAARGQLSQQGLKAVEREIV